MKTLEVWHECIHSLCSYSDIKNGFHIRGVKRLNFLVKTSQSCSALCDPWTVACQPPPSMEFSRQKHWSALPSPSPGDLPNPGIKPRSPVCRQILYQWATREAKRFHNSPPKLKYENIFPIMSPTWTPFCI